MELILMLLIIFSLYNLYKSKLLLSAISFLALNIILSILNFTNVLTILTAISMLLYGILPFVDGLQIILFIIFSLILITLIIRVSIDVKQYNNGKILLLINYINLVITLGNLFFYGILYTKLFFSEYNIESTIFNGIIIPFFLIFICLWQFIKIKNTQRKFERI